MESDRRRGRVRPSEQPLVAELFVPSRRNVAAAPTIERRSVPFHVRETIPRSAPYPDSTCAEGWRAGGSLRRRVRACPRAVPMLGSSGSCLATGRLSRRRLRAPLTGGAAILGRKSLAGLNLNSRTLRLRGESRGVSRAALAAGWEIGAHSLTHETCRDRGAALVSEVSAHGRRLLVGSVSCSSLLSGGAIHEEAGRSRPRCPGRRRDDHRARSRGESRA